MSGRATSLFRLEPPRAISRILSAGLGILMVLLWILCVLFLTGARSAAARVFVRIAAVALMQILWLGPGLLFAGCAVTAAKVQDRVLMGFAAACMLVAAPGFLIQAAGIAGLQVRLTSL